LKKLAIITTHPIQYNAPFFKLLTERGKVYPKVFYTWPQALEGFDDPDFGKKIQWDIPLLEGYEWEAVENVSKNPGSKRWSGIDCPGLNDRIKEFKPDAILVYGWNLKSHFRAMRYFKGKVAVWFTGDSTLLDEKPGWRKWARRILLTLVYRYIDKALYVGTNNKAYFKAHGVKEDQLIFFPHAIDNERFKDGPDKRYKEQALKWRKELGYKKDDFVVLFAGKLEDKKDPVLLLDAVQKINFEKRTEEGGTTVKAVHLLFVGNGLLENKLKERAKSDPYIQFLPFQNQAKMPIVYRLGNVFVLPSKGPGETWGLAVNEALACGVPAIVSDKVGCGIDLINSNKSSYMFETNQSTSLQNAIINSERIDIINNYNSSFLENLSFKNKSTILEKLIDSNFG
jgi:glycosyltransferase involved in cell wall biosynthesis